MSGVWLALVEAGLLPDAYRHAFMQHATLAALCLAPLLAALGTVAVAKRQVFFSQTIGHATLTGVALGLLLGEPLADPLAGLYGFCLITALLLTWLRRRGGAAASDAQTGVVLAQVLGLGIAALVLVTRSFNVHQIEATLFGSLITLTAADVRRVALLSAVIALLFTALYNPLLRATLDPTLSRTRGDAVGLLDYLFAVLLTVAIVMSVELVGALLVLVLVAIPATAARNLTERLSAHLWLSVALALVSSLGGLILAALLPLPAGVAITVVASVLFYLSLVPRVTGAAQPRSRP